MGIKGQRPGFELRFAYTVDGDKECLQALMRAAELAAARVAEGADGPVGELFEFVL